MAKCTTATCSNSSDSVTLIHDVTVASASIKFNIKFGGVHLKLPLIVLLSNGGATATNEAANVHPQTVKVDYNNPVRDPIRISVSVRTLSDLWYRNVTAL